MRVIKEKKLFIGKQEVSKNAMAKIIFVSAITLYLDAQSKNIPMYFR